MSALFTDPAVYEMGSTATLALACEFGANVGEGETLSLPVVELFDTLTGEPYAAGLAGAPVVNGTQVVQVFADLVRGHRYRVTWHATITNNKKPTFTTTLWVPI